MNTKKLTKRSFEHYESGKVRAGLRWEIRTDLGLETHECYQFDTAEEIIQKADVMQSVSGMEKVQIVTHKGQYQGMRILQEWTSLPRKFQKTVPEFRAKIEAIAERAGMDCLKVYSMWREYAKTCEAMDQSPVLFEFQLWNRATLNPNNEEEIR